MGLTLDSKRRLNNGVEIPLLGLGVFRSQPGGEAAAAVQWALEAGYRHIDTAAVYRNEADVAAGIRASGVPRSEIFITTKLANNDQGEGNFLPAFKESLKRLETDYVDMYLIHWPFPGRYVACWKALEEIYKAGGARAIGVSNFHQHHLNDIMAAATVAPAMNQFEMHPLLTQEPLVAYCEGLGVAPEAYSPLGGTGGSLLSDPTLKQVADRHGKSPAQVVLRWDLQRGVITIPKSVHQQRIIANAQLFNFELSAQEMATISGLNQNRRFGGDPETFFNRRPGGFGPRR